MKTELELQKEFIENPELKEQLEFIEKGGASGIQGVVLMDAFLKVEIGKLFNEDNMLFEKFSFIF